jgi:hypothetical protein
MYVLVEVVIDDVIMVVAELLSVAVALEVIVVEKVDVLMRVVVI